MKTLLSTFTLAVSLTALGSATAAQAQQAAQPGAAATRPALTREDVQNDLADWRQAGFDEWQYEFQVNVFDAEYQRRYAEYLRLREARQARAQKVAGK